MRRRGRSNNNNPRPTARRRLNPEDEYVKLRVYSSNNIYEMSPDRFVIFPMELVPTEKMVKLEEEFTPMFISTLTAHTFIYPPGVIFKEGNDYFLEISLENLERTPRERTDLENWDGEEPGRNPGSIKIKINMENGALDHIDIPYMDDGPWKFYSFNPIGVDQLGTKGLLIPTDRRELESAEGALQEYRIERERIRRMIEEERRNQETFPGRSGNDRYGVGHTIGGKRRRKKRTKKKSRKKKRKTLKKKRKRRKKKRKTRR